MGYVDIDIEEETLCRECERKACGSVGVFMAPSDSSNVVAKVWAVFSVMVVCVVRLTKSKLMMALVRLALLKR